MDTKWISKSKDFLLGTTLKKTVFFIIILVICAVTSIDVFNPDNLYKFFNKDEYIYEELLNSASTISEQLYKETDNLKKLSTGMIDSQNFYNRYKPYESTSDAILVPIRYLLYQKSTGATFTNCNTIYNGQDYQGYIRNNSYCSYTADNYHNYTPFARNTTHIVAFNGYSQDFTEYYWYDKNAPGAAKYMDNLINNKVYMLRIEISIFIVSVLILITILILKVINMAKYRKKLRLSGTKKSNYNAAAQSINRLMTYIMKLYASSSLMLKFFIMLVISLIVIIISAYLLIKRYFTFSYLIFSIFLALMIKEIIFKINSFNNIVDGVNNIALGNFSFTLKENGYGNLAKLSRTINSINAGYKIALDEQIKNERLKTELITNISHDLKTPLTSIINYVDLIQREDITNEEKTDYIKILDSKSKKLKMLIDNLFEVSKINSGKLDLHKENINIVNLIYQVLAEYNKNFEEKSLHPKINYNSYEVILHLDGKQMSRVIDNLLSNITKYSMPNTNVYIDIIEKDSDVTISFKNISVSEMSFSSEEIFERFKRGDASRNSSIEGSGLGLAISKSIVELHGGKIYIETEADLFKVYITFKVGNNINASSLSSTG